MAAVEDQEIPFFVPDIGLDVFPVDGELLLVEAHCCHQSVVSWEQGPAVVGVSLPIHDGIGGGVSDFHDEHAVVDGVGGIDVGDEAEDVGVFVKAVSLKGLVPSPFAVVVDGDIGGQGVK